ncbi:MAG: PIN domain-containing protein [Infirmifilum sp.]
MLILDTNVLVYASLEDSEHHEEALALLNEEDATVPQIVVYEYLRVIAELTGDPGFVAAKARELAELQVLCEAPRVLRLGVELWAKQGAPLRDLNDYIILALALTYRADLATYDQALRRLAEKHGVKTRPRVL